MLPFYYFLIVLQLGVKKRRMWFPIVSISALDKIGMDIKYNWPFMVYTCNQNSRLQLNVF